MINKSIICTLESQFEMRNIEVDIDSEIEFLHKFIIYDDSELIKSPYIKLATNDFINEIKKSEFDTGIMISSMKVNNLIIYLCILNTRIFIIKQINLPKFQEYFNEHKDLLIFKTAKCYDDFFKAIYSKFLNSEENNQHLNEQEDINKIIKKEIIGCIIKKSQYRTIKMRQEILPNKYNSKNNEYKIEYFLFNSIKRFQTFFILNFTNYLILILYIFC